MDSLLAGAPSGRLISGACPQAASISTFGPLGSSACLKTMGAEFLGWTKFDGSCGRGELRRSSQASRSTCSYLRHVINTLNFECTCQDATASVQTDGYSAFLLLATPAC
eukprot:scaffold206625_cov17-Tisochrysis_lutea.AAC.1